MTSKAKILPRKAANLPPYNINKLIRPGARVALQTAKREPGRSPDPKPFPPTVDNSDEAINAWQEQLDCLGPYGDPYLLYLHLKTAPPGADVGHLRGYVDARRFEPARSSGAEYIDGYHDGVTLNLTQSEAQFDDFFDMRDQRTAK